MKIICLFLYLYRHKLGLSFLTGIMHGIDSDFLILIVDISNSFSLNLTLVPSCEVQNGKHYDSSHLKSFSIRLEGKANSLILFWLIVCIQFEGAIKLMLHSNFSCCLLSAKSQLLHSNFSCCLSSAKSQ